MERSRDRVEKTEEEIAFKWQRKKGRGTERTAEVREIRDAGERGDRFYMREEAVSLAIQPACIRD
jgi:hypothetical protein